MPVAIHTLPSGALKLCYTLYIVERANVFIKLCNGTANL